MMLLFILSAGITVFLIAATVILMWGDNEVIDARLTEISALRVRIPPAFTDVPKRGLAGVASAVIDAFKPVRSFVSGTDADLSYKLTLAGFRKPEHVEVYTALKMLLPVCAVVAGTFYGGNMITVILVGVVCGFFAPDLVLARMISGRQESIRRALPDALDLLTICMHAGLGVDQALARVGDEMKRVAPALSEELQIIAREQHAGKPRLDAWRSMAERVNIEYVNQFVAMLIQTERFGTPIANSLGQFADALRTRQTQVAEEAAAKVGTKLLFPLIIFMSPSVFVVTVGPAAIAIQKVLLDLNMN
jgi:tight adherence protein C